MEKIGIIKKMVLLVDLSTEEQVELIKVLIAQWNLKCEDCFATIGQSSVVNSTPTETEKPKRGRPRKVQPLEQAIELQGEEKAKKRGRPRKVQPTDVTMDTKEEKTVQKKRGRPRKNLLEDQNEPNIQELKQIEEELREESFEADVVKGCDDKIKTLSAATKKRNQAFRYLADCPILNKMRMGSEQTFEILYRWEGENLLSPYVLVDLMPIGIYIPYKGKVFGKYRGFIVDIYDETVITDADLAVKEARAKPQIDDENWSIMNSLQWSLVKNMLEKVNRLLNKVGGDQFRGHYRTVSPGTDVIMGLGKIRYCIDVK